MGRYKIIDNTALCCFRQLILKIKSKLADKFMMIVFTLKKMIKN
ncbi:hypothetical protein [uncultured Gammaproteobacteria bacterium]|nr:hypothetical protein [uncultured Gammaproteobacteria bacterium]CAC9971075.1 hypothetical protein [uncultured Gammaproteobacteria bacterium]